MEDLGSFLIKMEGIKSLFLCKSTHYKQLFKDKLKMAEIKEKYEKKFCVAKIEEILSTNM